MGHNARQLVLYGRAEGYCHSNRRCPVTAYWYHAAETYYRLGLHIWGQRCLETAWTLEAIDKFKINVNTNLMVEGMR